MLRRSVESAGAKRTKRLRGWELALTNKLDPAISLLKLLRSDNSPELLLLWAEPHPWRREVKEDHPQVEHRLFDALS